MALEYLYQWRREYECDPDLKRRLGKEYVDAVEARIAEEEAKPEPAEDPDIEARYRKYVLNGRIIDPEYAAEHGLKITQDNISDGMMGYA